MSNPFRNTGITYFQVPDEIIKSGVLAKLRPTTLRAYLVLLFKVQRHSRPSALSITDAEMQELASISENSMTQARREMAKFKLANTQRGRGGVHAYTLLNPSTGAPIGPAQPGIAKPQLNAAQVTTEPTARELKPTIPSEPFKNFVAALTPQQIRRFFEAHSPAGTLKGSGTQLVARCPFHADENPSMSIDLEHGLWNCHAGCGSGGLVDWQMLRLPGLKRNQAARAIAEFFGKRDLIQSRRSTRAEAVYPYTDEDGVLLFDVLRYSGAEFRVRRPDPKNLNGYIRDVEGVRMVLYRLSQVGKATIIFVVEGEKDADRLSQPFENNPDVAVTTSPFGAKAKWRESYSKALTGKRVIIIPDNDPPGFAHADKVAAALKDHASEIHVVKLPDLGPGEDVSDYLDKHSFQEFLAEINKKL
ncbi:MAG: hypothetical protein JWO20_2510 [Candidatus Angelobacter sp.]|nr:hypothetical protein [Candidatus Angelobacter sp.]